MTPPTEDARSAPEERAEDNIVANWLLQWRGRVSTLNPDAFLDLQARIDAALATHARRLETMTDEVILSVRDPGPFRDSPWAPVADDATCQTAGSAALDSRPYSH